MVAKTEGAAIVRAIVGGLLTVPAGRGLSIAMSVYRIPAFDPWTLMVAVALVGTVLVVGFAIPARRALRVSPMDALRRD